VLLKHYVNTLIDKSRIRWSSLHDVEFDIWFSGLSFSVNVHHTAYTEA